MKDELRRILEESVPLTEDELETEKQVLISLVSDNCKWVKCPCCGEVIDKAKAIIPQKPSLQHGIPYCSEDCKSKHFSVLMF